MKFGMSVMPMEIALNIYFNIRTVSNTNMADEQTCEVGSTIVQLGVGPNSDVRL
jgi:hypothetical protein